MSRKYITDFLVCRAYELIRLAKATDAIQFPEQILALQTGQSEKVCLRAMERAESRGLIEYGVSLRSGWLTEKGKEYLRGGARSWDG